MFSGGILGNSLFFAVMNTTTVDNLTRASRVHHFAVLIPDPSGGPALGLSLTNNGHQPSCEASAANTRNFPQPPPPYGLVTFPSVQRTYAILQTPPGHNPYKLASRMENLRTVMGDQLLDWVLPVKSSPCCDHHQLNDGKESGSSGASMYKLGPVVDGMRAQIGVPGPFDGAHLQGKRRRRRRHRHSKRNGSRHRDHSGHSLPQDHSVVRHALRKKRRRHDISHDGG